MSLSCDYHDFGSPFDDSDADLILRSKPSEPTRENDHGVATQFRVHKVFLTKASPVFKKLLSEIHYPTNVARPRTLESIMKTCAAAKKYSMPSASALFRAMAYCPRMASVVTTQNAFRAFALAFEEGLTDEAFEAALGTLSLPHTIETYREDLCIASGPALYALWRYRPKSSQAIATGIQECVTEVGDLRDWLSSS